VDAQLARFESSRFAKHICLLFSTQFLSTPLHYPKHLLRVFVFAPLQLIRYALRLNILGVVGPISQTSLGQQRRTPTVSDINKQLALEGAQDRDLVRNSHPIIFSENLIRGTAKSRKSWKLLLEYRSTQYLSTIAFLEARCMEEYPQLLPA
jgi:hypothetical protein